MHLTLKQEVACSLNATNPGLPLLVMTVPGDLSPGVEAAAAAVAQVPAAGFQNLPPNYRKAWPAIAWPATLALRTCCCRRLRAASASPFGRELTTRPRNLRFLAACASATYAAFLPAAGGACAGADIREHHAGRTVRAKP